MCLHSDIVVGPPSIVETFLELGRNISRSTTGDGVMATGMGTSVGICSDVGSEEREGYEWQREQETHL